MRLFERIGPRHAVAFAIILCLTGVADAKKPKRARTRTAKPPTTQPVPKKAETPAPPPPPTTARELLQRLNHAKPDELKRGDIALRCALDFVLATAGADGARAAGLLEAVGYQPLPSDGDLPETPARPVEPAKVKELIAARRALTAVGDLPPDLFHIEHRNELAARSPAAAQWMLADDLALVIKPSDAVEGWVAQPAFLIVRIRAGKPTIMGGDVFERLSSPSH